MPHDSAYLVDILTAARRVLQFTQGVSWVEFQQNELLQDGVAHRISIIGEAASRVSQQMRDAHPEIEWRGMIGMRNRIIHEYFRVNLEVVGDVVQNDIPALISVIEPLIPPEDAA